MKHDIDYLGTDTLPEAALVVHSRCSGIRSMAQRLLCLLFADDNPTREFGGNLYDDIRGANNNKDLITHHAVSALASTVNYLRRHIGSESHLSAEVTSTDAVDNTASITISLEWGDQETEITTSWNI